MKKAFTLIELLVVIAIIAILAAILFPVFAQAKAAAKKTAALSNVKQLGTSYAIYMADVDDRMTPYMWQNRGGGVFITTMEVLFPYVKNRDIFLNQASSRSQGDFGINCATTANPVVMAHWIIPQWIRWDYYNWFGTTMFAGFSNQANPLTAGAGGPCDPAVLASRPWATCTEVQNAENPSSTALWIPGFFVTYNRPLPALEGSTQFGSACTIGFAPDSFVQSAARRNVHTFTDGQNYGMGDSSAKYFPTIRMNRDSSRGFQYGGAAYPSSPFMQVR